MNMLSKILQQTFILIFILSFAIVTINCGSAAPASTTDSGSVTSGDATTGDQDDADEYTEAEGTDEGEETEENKTIPTIKSLIDADAIKLSTDSSKNTTLISAKITNTYTVTFSESMDTTTINSDNIDVVCEKTTQKISAISAVKKGSDNIADNEFTITLKNQLPVYTDCSITFTDYISDLDGDYVDETSFDFTTNCSSSTTFGDADMFDECWETQNIPSGANVSFGKDSQVVMNLSTVNSSTNADMPFMYKLVNGDFEAVVYISKRNSDEGTEEIGLMVSTETPDVWGDSVHIGLYFSAGFGDENTYSNHYSGGAAQSIATATTYTANGIYLKIKREGQKYTTYYSSDNSSWTKDAEFTGVSNIGNTASVGIYGATGNTKGDFSVTIDSFEFLSGNAVDQD